jgi:hypothetical protein
MVDIRLLRHFAGPVIAFRPTNYNSQHMPCPTTSNIWIEWELQQTLHQLKPRTMGGLVHRSTCRAQRPSRCQHNLR